MTVGVEPCQADLFKGSAFVRERLAAESVFAVLEREGRRLFPEAMFDDLFSSRGRRSVPPRVVACVMVLQRWFGLSDREAVAAFEFDLRWRFACGGLDSTAGGSATRCWWGCGPGWRRLRSRGGSLTRCWPRPARRGRCLSGGCWTLCRYMTRWRPRTPRRCCSARSAPCSPRPQTRRSGWTRRCAATTPRAPSPAATGTTPGLDRSWWTVSGRTRPRCSPRSRAAGCAARSARPPSCWPRWPARTCARTAAGVS